MEEGVYYRCVALAVQALLQCTQDELTVWDKYIQLQVVHHTRGTKYIGRPLNQSSSSSPPNAPGTRRYLSARFTAL